LRGYQKGFVGKPRRLDALKNPQAQLQRKELGKFLREQVENSLKPNLRFVHIKK
jgi:hypothetical protein